MKTDPDVIIADEIVKFCRQNNYSHEQLMAALVRLSIITLITLNSTELSGEIANHSLEMKLSKVDYQS